MSGRLVLLGLVGAACCANVYGEPALRSARQVALQKLGAEALQVAVPNSSTRMAAILESNLREERAKKKALSAQVDMLTKDLEGILRPARAPVAHAVDTKNSVHDEVRGNEQPYKDEKLVNKYHGKSSKDVWGGENPGRGH